MKWRFLFIIGPLLILACTQEVSTRPNFRFKPAPDQNTVAKVLGNDISHSEMTKGIESDIFDLEMKLYELKFQKLKSMVLEKFIQKNPKKKNLTNDQFLEREISSGIKVSEKEVMAFAKERKIPKTHINSQLKGRIKKYLSTEKRKDAIDQWLAKQTKKNPVDIYLKKPSRPTFNVQAGNSPFYGKADSKVTLIEFSDFQCPFCAKGADVLKKIKKHYGKKVKIVFKHFPLSFHKNAKQAAVASMCANEQGNAKFWDLHDTMFKDQASLDNEGLKKMAKKIGLDSGKFESCLGSSKYESMINSDIQEGERVGVRSTPTFFVNGKLVNGAQPFDTFKEIIDEELK